MMNFSKLLLLCLFVPITYFTSMGQSGDPRQYYCPKSKEPIIIDGSLDDASWKLADWTEEFVDIEGNKKPAPLYSTRVKMLWDEEYFYIAAQMEEPHLWATYDQRDAIIFHENDFEVFIDPNSDTHQYYELEINALGTVWDLMLIKPYRDGGPAINAWDIAGLKKGIKLNGTLNNPNDLDEGWSIELALPWKILKEAANQGKKPSAGDSWRVNFSRVNWRTKNNNGTYAKQTNPATGKSYPEFNWVWSPQGVIAMHQPETWGYVHFVDSAIHLQPMTVSPEPLVLREIYSAQKAYFEKNQKFAQKASQLNSKKIDRSDINIYCTPSLFEAIIDLGDIVWHIDQDGRIWKTKNKS